MNPIVSSHERIQKALNREIAGRRFLIWICIVVNSAAFLHLVTSWNRIGKLHDFGDYFNCVLILMLETLEAVGAWGVLGKKTRTVFLISFGAMLVRILRSVF